MRELAGVPGMYYGGETARTALYVRGFSPAYIVDGMPAYITQLQLDPEEIESVTLVRDVADKALFGSRAANGVLHITTRRGLTRGRTIRFGFESGVSIVDLSINVPNLAAAQSVCESWPYKYQNVYDKIMEELL